MRKLALLAVLTVGALAGADDPANTGAAKGDRRPAPAMIPDPRWQPKPGDRVEVWGSPGAGATSPQAFARYAKARKAGDAAGMRPLRESGSVVELAIGTQVLVIAYRSPFSDGGGGRGRERAQAMLVGQFGHNAHSA